MRKESTAAMGMAASQARLLSLTARLTDNEMRSQMISNSKVRLADKTNVASKEYMNSLSTTQLLYSTYDASGEKTYQSLTAGIINEYGPLKNQYGIVNTSGHIMVNGVDGANYAKSATLQEFLDCYKLYDDKNKKIPNPDWEKQAEIVYGKRYDLWVEQNNWSTIIGTDFNEDHILDNDQAARTPGGTMGDWIDEMKKRPAEVGTEPIAPDPNDPKYNFTDIWETYKKSACFDDVTDDSDSSLWHMDHVLSHLFHHKNNDVTITSSTGGTVTIKAGGSGAYFSGHSPSNEDTVYEPVRSALQEEYPDLYQQAVDLYVELIKNMDSKRSKESGSTYTSGGSPTMSNTEIHNLYLAFNEKVKEVSEEGKHQYDKDLEEWQKEHDAWAERLKQWNEWLTRCEQKKTIYIEQLAILDGMDKFMDDPYREINDKDKAEWYTNLWYRMGGKDENHKDKDKYEVLDERLSNNADWLKFALDHGVISMEQVKTVEEDDEYAKLETKTWKSIIYSSAADVTEQDNQVAITRAEVKYTKALKDIEYKDKQYDQDLKKLDTEHNAIQTEYDSLKTVIQKNQERSFKAFS